MHKPAPKKRKSTPRKPKKHPGGRPSKYEKRFCHMAKLCIEQGGFSMAKLSKLFEVNRDTIYEWMRAHKEFSDIVEKARDYYDGIKISKSLIKRAVGFRYTEATREPDINGQMVVTKKVSKYYPPDTAAIKHWQVNRDPARWSDKFSVGLTSETLDAILTGLPEDYAAAVREELSRIAKDRRTG